VGHILECRSQACIAYQPFQGTEATMTLASEIPTSTNFVSWLVAVLKVSYLSAVAFFSMLALLAVIYFAIHSPAAASLFVNFPD
jgi:hypothetical protein